jgi:hypothetical protein
MLNFQYIFNTSFPVSYHKSPSTGVDGADADFTTLASLPSLAFVIEPSDNLAISKVPVVNELALSLGGTLSKTTYFNVSIII